MSSVPAYRVHLVLDPDFGRRLTELPIGEPIWIVASVINEPVVRQLWQERPAEGHLDGITLFRSSGSPRDAFLDEIDTVDLHHGEYSSQPWYSILNVIGCQPSGEIRSALSTQGFCVTDIFPEGFLAQRRTSDSLAPGESAL